MGQLSCKRCGAHAEGDTRDEADAKIDHSLGQKIGRPCSGNQKDLDWDGSVTGKRPEAKPEPTPEPEAEPVVESDSPKPKKSKKPKRR